MIIRQLIPLMVYCFIFSKWPTLILGDASIDRNISVYTNNICFGRKCFLFGIAINLLLLWKNSDLDSKGFSRRVLTDKSISRKLRLGT